MHHELNDHQSHQRHEADISCIRPQWYIVTKSKKQQLKLVCRYDPQSFEHLTSVAAREHFRNPSTIAAMKMHVPGSTAITELVEQFHQLHECLDSVCVPLKITRVLMSCSDRRGHQFRAQDGGPCERCLRITAAKEQYVEKRAETG